jgi:hypothetical protein
VFGSSKRDQWGPEGLVAVSQSYQLYSGINKLINDKADCSLKTVEEYIPKFDAIDTARFAYSNRWADEARADSKSGGSYNLLFASIHNIQESAKALWACYAIDSADPGSDIANRGIQVYRGAVDNCWGNAQQLPRYGYKMAQNFGAQWMMEMMPLFTTAELWHDISKKAIDLDAVPEQWFPRV